MGEREGERCGDREEDTWWHGGTEEGGCVDTHGCNFSDISRAHEDSVVTQGVSGADMAVDFKHWFLDLHTAS
jgi:hypothetical protein